MGEPHLTLKGVRQALLLSRKMSGPDGSPLYAYRFKTSEYDRVREFLRACGLNVLRDPGGGALLVMYLAEWFRRERHGGGWDWVTPLGQLGIRYHATEVWADVRYPEVRDCVEGGLRAWGRSASSRLSLLTTVVQESGFPAADIARGRLGVWLRRSVLTADRGLNAYDAVTEEAWRAPETLVQALFDSAVKLCDAVVRLRRKVSGGEGDALIALDRLEPTWRTSLPFDVQDDHFRSLVEELVVARQAEDPALFVERRYVLADGRWVGQAEVKLGGVLDEPRSPPDLLAGLASYGRARLYPRGEAFRWTTPIATVEREPTDDGVEQWRIRALVPRYRPTLDHDQEVRMAVEAGEGQIAEFVPLGGQPLAGSVIALRLGDTDNPYETRVLEVLGESPVKTTRPWLVLALSDLAAQKASIEGEHFYLPDPTLDGRRLLAFSGAVRLEIDGEPCVWMTSAKVENAERLVLVGRRVRKLRESVFAGSPAVWLERDGRTSSVRASETYWKPVGHGAWRSITTALPNGEVYFAVRRENRVALMTKTAVAPAALQFRADRSARRLYVEGLAGAAVRAFAERVPLETEVTSTDAQVQLDRLPPGGAVRLRLTWDSSLEVSLDDPLAEPMLLDGDGREAPVHAALALSRLRGHRLLSHGANELLFEGRAPNASPILTTRTVIGSIPLGAFEQVIDELLGAFDSLDAKVRLSWAHRGDWFAEVGRWQVSHPLQPIRQDSVFALLAKQNSPRRRAMSLYAPSAGVVTDLVDNDPSVLSDRLRSDLAPGPWLLTGVEPDGTVLRPTVLADRLSARGQNGRLASVHGLAQDLSVSVGQDDLAASTPAQGEELRLLVDLYMAAKAIDAPYAAIDALRTLANTTRQTPMILASCRSDDERYAVLDIQASLPFLWCTTEITTWKIAFASAFVARRDQLADAGMTDAAQIAAAVTVRALGQIAEAFPVLTTHARLCMVELNGLLAQAEIPYALTRPSSFESFAMIAQRLVARRPDDRVLALPRLSDLVGDRAVFCRNFGDGQRFAEVLAAPLVAARLAAGRLEPNPTTVAACRSAWTWDREYFDDAFRAALVAEAQAPVLPEIR